MISVYTLGGVEMDEATKVVIEAIWSGLLLLRLIAGSFFGTLAFRFVMDMCDPDDGDRKGKGSK